MANGYFERGEIYAVRMDMGVGSEEGSFRPGVIVSNNKGNTTQETVLVVYMTTHAKYQSIYFGTMATGKRAWVMTNQIATVDKSRLNPRPMGVLTDEEMRKLEDCLEEVFDLGYTDDVTVREKETEIEVLKAEIEELKAQLAAKDEENKDELLSLRAESEMFQKLYGKVLDQVVSLKLGADIAMRMEKKTPVVAVAVEKEKPDEVVEAVEEKVDINNCTQTALKKIGFSLPMARLIVSRRPYKTVSDLKTVPGMKASFFRIVESKLCCTPMPVEPEKVVVIKDAPDPGYEVERKVNVNTATAKEICEVTGIYMSMAYSITGYRNKNGRFKSLNDLLNIPRFGETCLKRYGDKMEV